jgi:hypothetical protein
VCGSGGKPKNWVPLIKALNIDWGKEKVRLVFENPGSETYGCFPSGFEVQDQQSQLEQLLESEQFTDLKLIGHSEGAAAIVNVLNNLAENDDYLTQYDVRGQLKAAVMLDNITGVSDLPVAGWNDTAYNNLPKRLVEKAPNAQLLDVWNRASIVHNTGKMPGWKSENSYSYDSRPWWISGFQTFHPAGPVARIAGTATSYHGDPMSNPDVIDQVVRMMRGY